MMQNPRPDPHIAFEHLGYLVECCGDRRVGTPGNALAAAYISRIMTDAGYRVECEYFHTPGGVQEPFAVTMAMGFVSSWLLSRGGRLSRLAGLATAGLMAASVVGEETTLFHPARAFFPRKKGRNIVCRPEGARSDEVPAVLVVAHYDTVNEDYSFRPGLVRFLPAGYRFYCAFPLLGVLSSRARKRTWGRLYRLAMLCGAAGLLHWLYSGEANPGANDNGSGVAVALRVAEELGGEGGRCPDTWFLFTDAEEAGLSGMLDFCRSYAGLPGRTHVVNLESVGSGKLHYLEREGQLIRRKSYGRLHELVRSYARENGLEIASRREVTFGTDALVAVARGCSTVTLTRLDSEGFIPGWHFEDSLDGIDGDALEETAVFARGLVEFLENRGGV